MEVTHTDLAQEVLKIANLPEEGGSPDSLDMVVDKAQMDYITDLFRKDLDNPETEEELIFEDGVLCSEVELSEAQRKTTELVKAWVPTGKVVFTRSKIAKILKQIRRLTRLGGFSGSSIPMTCLGPVCPMVQDRTTAIFNMKLKAGETNSSKRPEPDLSKCRCSLYEAGIAPIGDPCPLEEIQGETFRRNLYDALGVNESTDTVHVHLIASLALWVTLQNRILAELSMDPETLVEVDIGAFSSPNGPVVLKGKNTNPLLDALDKVQDRIDKLRKQLLATPEQQQKVKPRNEIATIKVVQTNRKDAMEVSTTSLESLLVRKEEVADNG